MLNENPTYTGHGMTSTCLDKVCSTAKQHIYMYKCKKALLVALDGKLYEVAKLYNSHLSCLHLSYGLVNLSKINVLINGHKFSTA